MVSGPSAQPAGFHGYVGGVGCGQWADHPASRVSFREGINSRCYHEPIQDLSRERHRCGPEITLSRSYSVTLPRSSSVASSLDVEDWV